MESGGPSARAAVGVAAALMVVAAAENTVAPWAPFYVVYAALTLVLPVIFGSVTRARFRLPRWPYWLAAIGLAVVLQGVFRLLFRTVDLVGMFGVVVGFRFGGVVVRGGPTSPALHAAAAGRVSGGR